MFKLINFNFRKIFFRFFVILKYKKNILFYLLYFALFYTHNATLLLDHSSFHTRSFSLILSLSLSFSLFSSIHSLSLDPSPFHSLSLYPSPFYSLSLYLFPFTLSLSRSLFLSISFSLSLSLSLSIPPFTLFLSSLCVSDGISLYLSLWPKWTFSSLLYLNLNRKTV